MPAADPTTGLQRRTLLPLLALWGTGLAPQITRADASDSTDRHLGQAWRLPAGNTLLALASLGLDLGSALAAVQDWHIPVNSRLVLDLSDGDHPQSKPLWISHPDGARLVIRGNPAHPARCRLHWRHGGDGLCVGTGSVLGWLEGVTLVQEHQQGVGSGLLADEGGALLCASTVQVENFYYGVQARRNGTVRCDGITCKGGGDANFFAFMGGHVQAQRTLAVGANDPDKRLGSGFVAEYGGSIDASGATARFNALDGYTALSNGVIRAYDSVAQYNRRAGYFTDTGGRIVAHRALAEANCGDGLAMRDDSRGITGQGMRQQGNGAPEPTCRESTQ